MSLSVDRDYVREAVERQMSSHAFAEFCVAHATDPHFRFLFLETDPERKRYERLLRERYDQLHSTSSTTCGDAEADAVRQSTPLDAVACGHSVHGNGRREGEERGGGDEVVEVRGVVGHTRVARECLTGHRGGRCGHDGCQRERAEEGYACNMRFGNCEGLCTVSVAVNVSALERGWAIWRHEPNTRTQEPHAPYRLPRTALEQFLGLTWQCIPIGATGGWHPSIHGYITCASSLALPSLVQDEAAVEWVTFVSRRRTQWSTCLWLLSRLMKAMVTAAAPLHKGKGMEKEEGEEFAAAAEPSTSALLTSELFRFPVVSSATSPAVAAAATMDAFIRLQSTTSALASLWMLSALAHTHIVVATTSSSSSSPVRGSTALSKSVVRDPRWEASVAAYTSMASRSFWDATETLRVTMEVDTNEQLERWGLWRRGGGGEGASHAGIQHAARSAAALSAAEDSCRLYLARVRRAVKETAAIWHQHGALPMASTATDATSLHWLLHKD